MQQLLLAEFFEHITLKQYLTVTLVPMNWKITFEIYTVVEVLIMTIWDLTPYCHIYGHHLLPEVGSIMHL
jgi:hypothetical protein